MDDVQQIEDEERQRIDAALHRQEEQLFVEEVGLAFERLGHPRMAGRVMGLLLIADPPYLCVTEMSDLLQASKGSISTMTHLLLQLGRSSTWVCRPAGAPFFGSRRTPGRSCCGRAPSRRPSCARSPNAAAPDARPPDGGRAAIAGRDA